MKRSLILVLLACSPAHAGITWVDLHLGSLHTKTTVQDNTGADRELNPINLGLGLTYTPESKDASDVRFGALINSYKDLSAYVGINPHTSYDRDWAVGVIAGVITGYGKSTNQSNVMGMLVPHITYLFDNYRAELSFVYGKQTSALGLTMGVMF